MTNSCALIHLFQIGQEHRQAYSIRHRAGSIFVCGGIEDVTIKKNTVFHIYVPWCPKCVNKYLKWKHVLKDIVSHKTVHTKDKMDAHMESFN